MLFRFVSHIIIILAGSSAIITAILASNTMTASGDIIAGTFSFNIWWGFGPSIVLLAIGIIPFLWTQYQEDLHIEIQRGGMPPIHRADAIKIGFSLGGTGFLCFGMIAGEFGMLIAGVVLVVIASAFAAQPMIRDFYH